MRPRFFLITNQLERNTYTAMRYLTFFLSAGLAFACPLSASALDISGTSRTYLLSRQTVDSTRLMPLYEYLDFRAGSGDPGEVSFNFGGWYRYDLKNESPNGKYNDDLQYAYLSFRGERGNKTLNLGRLRVHEGVASELVDGAYGRADLLGGFGVAAYGGSPVETRFDTRRGDSIYGGRIFHGVPGLYTLGASYLDERNGNSAFRREEGADVWLRPASWLELQGMSSYNALSRNWMQHNYYASVGPFSGLRLNGEFSRVSYKDYFVGATMSAFTFPRINPNETVTAAGGSASYAITRSLTAAADYKNFSYRIAGRAGYYGGKLSYAGESFGAGAGFHRMDGDTDTLRYDEGSVYFMRKISAFDISVQGILVSYKQEINGVKDAYTASAAAGYSFSPKARLAADVQYSKNPDFNRDTRGMLTFVYHFDTAFERKLMKPKT